MQLLNCCLIGAVNSGGVGGGSCERVFEYFTRVNTEGVLDFVSKDLKPGFITVER